MPLPTPRRHSKIEVPIHFVWATLERRPLLVPQVERVAYRAIQSKSQELEATVLALGGLADHVHLAVLFSPNVSIAQFVRQVKRAATVAIRNQFGEAINFAWQDGYSAFAFPKAKRDIVIRYIQNQKTKHDAKTTFGCWEEIGELRHLKEDVPEPWSVPR